jgi:hypothetical protein
MQICISMHQNLALLHRAAALPEIRLLQRLFQSGAALDGRHFYV